MGVADFDLIFCNRRLGSFAHSIDVGYSIEKMLD